jgi:spore coat polysaccharide biosynthesis protein SpsF
VSFMPAQKSKKPAIITQARMTSTRLPGKVLMNIKGKSLLDYHLDRLKLSNLPIIVATTINKEDDPIVDWAEKRGINFYRGSESDVLSRYYETALKFQVEIVIRVTSDCPLIDGRVIGQAYEKYVAHANDKLYLSNTVQRTFPRGFDFEIFSFDLLDWAHKNARKDHEREHVTPFIHSDASGNVKLDQFLNSEDLSDWRITVDTKDDFSLVSTLINEFGANNLDLAEFNRLLRNNPDLKRINSHIEQKPIS